MLLSEYVSFECHQVLPSVTDSLSGESLVSFRHNLPAALSKSGAKLLKINEQNRAIAPVLTILFPRDRLGLLGNSRSCVFIRVQIISQWTTKKSEGPARVRFPPPGLQRVIRSFLLRATVPYTFKREARHTIFATRMIRANLVLRRRVRFLRKSSTLMPHYHTLKRTCMRIYSSRPKESR